MIKTTRIQDIKIQYDMLYKYCHTYKIQVDEETKCKTLHPELKRHVQEDKTEEDVNEKDEVPRNINGKVVLIKQNPTRTRFRIERGAEGLMRASIIEATTPNKEITNPNSFDILQDEVNGNRYI